MAEESGEENPLLGGKPKAGRPSHDNSMIEMDGIRPTAECDPASMNRGSDAKVSLLALEASEADDTLDYVWVGFAYFLKVMFTFGASPSLWVWQERGSDKHDRARRKLTDLFSMPNVAIASHYWNVGLAMNFLSTPISYYLVDTLDAEANVVNQYSVGE
jgi:hypothetical protein